MWMGVFVCVYVGMCDCVLMCVYVYTFMCVYVCVTLSAVFIQNEVEKKKM